MQLDLSTNYTRTICAVTIKNQPENRFRSFNNRQLTYVFRGEVTAASKLFQYWNDLNCIIQMPA